MHLCLLAKRHVRAVCLDVHPVALPTSVTICLSTGHAARVRGQACSGPHQAFLLGLTPGLDGRAGTWIRGQPSLGPRVNLLTCGPRCCSS